MTIRYTEIRSRHWDGAIKEIVAKLDELKVKRGQLLSIDVHANDPYGDGIISAIWNDSFVSKGDLRLGCIYRENVESWMDAYEGIAYHASELDPEAIISITGSADGVGGQKSFLILFYYEDIPLAKEKQDIKYCEVRNKYWHDAAGGIISTLRNEGAKQGQVISIDAHSNYPDPSQDAIFHAFWNASIPSQGELETEFEERNTSGSWDSFYIWAVNVISGKMIETTSITCSFNYGRKGVSFVFYNKDSIKDVSYDLEKGTVTNTQKKILATLKNRNDTDIAQELDFAYSETLSNSSTFSNEAGATITAGIEFDAGVPFIMEGKISLELSATYTHTWGQTTETDETTVSGAKNMAPPHTEVTCEFSVFQSELEVPYKITMRSGYENVGIWKGVNYWDVNTEFTDKKI